jgi:acyl carrier protein
MNHAKEIREFVISNFLFGDAAALEDDRSFLDSDIVDSTGMLELIMFLEGTYGIRVEPEEMVPENLDSVNRLVEFLGKKQAQVTP